MKIYNMTKGQLITLWAFGVLYWLLNFFALTERESLVSVVLFVLIPAFLIFYTLGWINYKEK